MTLAVRHLAVACCASLLAAVTPASAQSSRYGGKLLLTGGVSSIDGAAGGGLTPWAVTGGYGTAGEFGGNLFATRIETQDFSLNDFGLALAWNDRIELSLARQDFDTGPVGNAFGLPGLRLKQDILGLKLRVFGDAVLDSDTWTPQVAIGAQYKKADAGGLTPTLESLGVDDSGTDFYVSATKLFLAQGVLVNGTLRATRANQNGLLGFGSSGHDHYSMQPEFSVAWLLNRNLAVGAEYRFKPDNLRDNPALKEDDWADVFVAWAPTKFASITAAYVDLGKIVPGVVDKRQRGYYLSLQLSL
jgi:hypothetical protein